MANNLVKQNVMVKIPGLNGGLAFKVQFEHCPSCKYFDSCYPDGRGPNYLDPDCATGHVNK